MLTPQKAADRAGVSRRTIMLAIEKRTINAIRDNKNRWQIREDDLQDWISRRTPQVKPVEDTSYGASNDTFSAEMRIGITKLEAELHAAQARIEDLEADRDAWKEQARTLATRSSWFWPWSRRQ